MKVDGRPDGSAGEVVLTTGLQPSIAAGRLVFARASASRGADLFQMRSPGCWRGPRHTARTISGAVMRVDWAGRQRSRWGHHAIARVGYDVSPDGKRLLMVDEMTGDEQRGTSVTVAQNWFAAFKK
jgi:hypothetical protein